MSEKLVDAIEEGKIVKVSEMYAKKEGLPILRKSHISQAPTQSINQKKGMFEASTINMLDFLRKPADWKEKQVISELIENFHWHIRVERRKKGLSRKQLSRLINEPESHLKILEHGRLPEKDFKLINKVQQTLKINLRKDKRDFSKDLPEIMPKQETPQRKEPIEGLFGDDIEIIED